VLSIRLSKFGKLRTADLSESCEGPTSPSSPCRPPTGGRKCPRRLCFEYGHSVVIPQCSVDVPSACTTLDSRSGLERAALGSMVFAIDSQYKPCLTLIGKGKMQKRGA